MACVIIIQIQSKHQLDGGQWKNDRKLQSLFFLRRIFISNILFKFQKFTSKYKFNFSNNILNRTPGLENSGEIVWKLVLALGVAWIIVFFCIFKGIKSSGKVVYFTSVFPFVVLIILGINGWTLKGSEVGMLYFFKPDFLKLTEANVWFDAAVQVFFSMGTCSGGLITLSSYNKFTEPTLRNTFIITLTSSITAIFSGFVVFSYIGYLAHVTNQEVKDVVSSGSGLSFIVFPFAATSIPGAPFWSVIFFIMMLTLGLDSQVI